MPDFDDRDRMPDDVDGDRIPDDIDMHVPGVRRRMAITRNGKKPLLAGVLALILLVYTAFKVCGDEPSQTSPAASQAPPAVQVSLLADTVFTVTARKNEWSVPVRVPLGYRIRAERILDSPAYEFRTQTGRIDTVPRGPLDSIQEIPGRLETLEFRVVPEEEADSVVVIRILLSPLP